MMHSSGLRAVDSLTGALAGGSLVELAGPADTGKTALALWYCRTALALPETAVGWIMTETPLSCASLLWAGLDTSRFLVVRQSPALPGLSVARELVQAGCGLVVIDSLAALVGADLEICLPQVLARALSPLKRAAQEADALVILTNQERGVGRSRVVMSSGASPVLLRVLDYRLRLRAGAGVYQHGLLRGVRTHAEVVKAGRDLDQIGRRATFVNDFERGLRDLQSTK